MNNSGLLSSVCVDNISADVLHRATSFWSAEGKLLSQKLIDLNMEMSWNRHGTRIEKFGQIGSMPVRKWFPFAVLEDTKTSEFIGMQIYCASSWQIEVFRTDEPLTLCGGLADFDYGHFSKTIHPGESFTSPKAVVELILILISIFWDMILLTPLEVSLMGTIEAEHFI